MQDGVTIGTDGTEIRVRVDLVLAPDFRQRTNVMDVNESFGYGSINIPKGRSAHRARCSMSSETGLPRALIAFVGVDRDSARRTLVERPVVDFFWKADRN
jgi:hypothetical protein